ncbi:hypothetical protein, partial [Serratia nevei]|uniref:hypothetical protein n=1 Tax=Serratia nevei TaxID=2703794 RepID=UPI0037DD2E1D
VYHPSAEPPPVMFSGTESSGVNETINATNVDRPSLSEEKTASPYDIDLRSSDRAKDALCSVIASPEQSI